MICTQNHLITIIYSNSIQLSNPKKKKQKLPDSLGLISGKFWAYESDQKINHGKKERHTPFTNKKRGGSKDIKHLCLRLCLMAHTHNVKFEIQKQSSITTVWNYVTHQHNCEYPLFALISQQAEAALHAIPWNQSHLQSKKKKKKTQLI